MIFEKEYQKISMNHERARAKSYKAGKAECEQIRTKGLYFVAGKLKQPRKS